MIDQSKDEMHATLTVAHALLRQNGPTEAGVDRPHAGQHVLDEPDMAGYVDEGENGTRWQRRVSEAQVDGQPAGLLLGEPVGVGSGEGLHEGRLAVVDVSGGGDYVHAMSACEGGNRGSHDSVVVRVDGPEVQDRRTVGHPGDYRWVPGP